MTAHSLPHTPSSGQVRTARTKRSKERDSCNHAKRAKQKKRRAPCSPQGEYRRNRRTRDEPSDVECGLMQAHCQCTRPLVKRRYQYIGRWRIERLRHNHCERHKQEQRPKTACRTSEQGHQAPQGGCDADKPCAVNTICNKTGKRSKYRIGPEYRRAQNPHLHIREPHLALNRNHQQPQERTVNRIDDKYAAQESQRKPLCLRVAANRENIWTLGFRFHRM